MSNQELLQKVYADFTEFLYNNDGMPMAGDIAPALEFILKPYVEKFTQEVLARVEAAARELERAKAKIVRQDAAINYMLPLVNPTVAQHVKKEIWE